MRRLAERRGWQTRPTVGRGETVVDLVATRPDDLGLATMLYLRCDARADPADEAAVRALNAVLRQRPGAGGVLVCPAGFTADARSLAAERGIGLWDREQLATG